LKIVLEEITACTPNCQGKDQFNQSLVRRAFLGEIEIPLFYLEQRGEEGSVGVPLKNAAGSQQGCVAGVKVVDGFFLLITQGADPRLVRPPSLSHPGRDGIIYQLESMVTEARREGLRELSGVFNYFFCPGSGGIVPYLQPLVELVRQGG